MKCFENIISFIVLALIASTLTPAITYTSDLGELSVGYVELETTGYNTTFTWDLSAERTGNLGVATYSWMMDTYLVAWVNETNADYHEGPLYAYIENTTGYSQYATIESSASVKGVDIVVAGRRSFLVGYTMYGNNLDTYAAVVKWDGTRYTAVKIGLGTTNGYEEYVSAAYLVDKYLVVFYNSSSLYGVIVDEDGNIIATPGYIAYTGLSYDSTDLGFVVVAGYDEWLVFYSSSDGYIYAKRILPDGAVYSTSISIPGRLYTAHGGVYSYGKYIIPYIDSNDRPSIAIIDARYPSNIQVYTYTLSSQGSYPLIVAGNRYVLAVWKDTSIDSNGNVYGRLIYPFNNSISGIIDIGRDTGNNPDNHVFATYNYRYDVYVIVWSSERNGDPDNRVYVATLSEAEDLGSVSVFDLSGFTGPFYPHGVASGRDGKVFVASKYYPASDNSDAYIVYGYLGSDASLPTIYPVYGYEALFYATPDEGANARDSIVELIASARTNVSVAAYQLGLSSSYGDEYVAEYIVEALVKAVYRLGPGNVFFITDGYYTGFYDVWYLSRYVKIHSDSSGYYMHHKSIVVDNEYVVLSTANYDRYEFLSDRNIVLILHSPEIAERFTAEHKEMINGVFHGGSPTSSPFFQTTINGTTSRVWVFFSPDDFPESSNTILEFIENATRSIHLMMYHFTNDTFAQALIQAHSNGLDVKAIFEAGSYWRDSDVHDYDTLVENGVYATLDKDNEDPANDKWYPLFHVKAMVIDHEIVYIGSAQFTYNGFRENDEYMVIINNTQLASKFEEFFQKYWSRYTGRINVEVIYTNNTPVENVRVETMETWKTNTYSRVNHTGIDGRATLYLVYPYMNQSTTETYTIYAEYWGLTASKTVSVSSGSSTNVKFYVTATSTVLTGPSTVNVGASSSYTITLINESSGSPVNIDTNVEVYVDGSLYRTVALTDGSGSFTISFDTVGTHTIDVFFYGVVDGDELVLKSNTTASINVVKNATSIKIYTPDIIDENQSFTVLLRLVDGDDKPVSGETLDLYVKQDTTTLYHLQGITNTSGYVEINISGLLGGSYVLEAVYNGSNLYESTSNSTTITVRHGTRIIIDTPVSVEEDTLFYVYARIVSTVTSTPLSGIPLILTVQGTAITVSNTTNTSGWAMFKLNIPDPGTYIIVVEYSGSTSYMPSTATTTIEVTARPVTVETDIEVYGPLNGKVYEELIYTVKLVDKDTREVLGLNTTMKLYVNGTLYSIVEITGGEGSFTVKPDRAGSLNITLIYEGETIGSTTYTSSRYTLFADISERQTILVLSVEPAEIHVWDNVVVTARLLDENSTPLPGEEIELSINGSYTIISATNSSGYISYVFKAERLGSLTISAIYGGRGGVYTGSSAQITRTVYKRPSPLLEADIRYEELNATHIVLNITGRVLDALNGSGIDGWVRVYVDKGGGYIYVGNTTVVNGYFSFNGIVDPVEVKLEYVPPSPAYYESTPSKTYILLALMPAPEPWILPILLLSTLIILAVIRRRKR